jgi:hypothetical protein
LLRRLGGPQWAALQLGDDMFLLVLLLPLIPLLLAMLQL